MKVLILGLTVISLMGVIASTDPGISSKRDPRLFFGLRNVLNNDDNCAKCDIIRQIHNKNTIQDAIITALQGLVVANAKRCPTAAVGARRIGDKCFTVSTNAVRAGVAQLACLNMGGYLAEPPLTVTGLAEFAQNINTVFNANIATAWIGLVEIPGTDDLFSYRHNGYTNYDRHIPVFTGLAVGDLEAATIAIPGGTLTANLASITASFICEYDLI